MNKAAAPAIACAPKSTPSRTAALTLGALGVVFGDIGTSPIYAMRESVRATGGAMPGPAAVMGALSAIIWALILVVTVKYVILIMRADNQGEGGVLALAALAHRSPRLRRRVKNVIGIAALLGLALFFGDGMLTPAISVLSAVEGLSVEAASLQPLVVPSTLVILIALFVMQSRGTASIGRLFGPVMVVWFVVLAVLGVRGIAQDPGILFALNPLYAIMLFVRAPWTAFVALGSVVLAVTGCEALYADMGHFGKGPIRNAWMYFVLPALLLNYLGQGAELLRNPALAGIPFYALAPHWAHYPLVLLATVATIIASQAVISGVFSIARQAVQLGRLPRMEIRHTSATDFGQIYVPRMNVILCIGVVLIVLIFHTSGSLAAAYGIAVSGVMAIDTFHASIVATKQWHWSLRATIALFGILCLIDISFLAANSLKVVQGGWLPLLIAGCVFLIMEIWRTGRRIHLEKLRDETLPLDLFLQRADRTPQRVSGTAVFLSARGDIVPGALLHSLKHYKVLHERVVIAHAVVEEVPIVPAARRLEVRKLGKGFFGVTVHHGFFETPDIPKILEGARAFGLVIDVPNTTFFIGRESLVPAEHPVLGRWATWVYLRLAASALSPARFYHLPPNRVVEFGTQIAL
ncbi:MAG TPA: potassium transporter Kup [Rhizomicrobium sp.]|jgi:KUP system potassium uptake protein|nr:potassium transporter Kup [Rhizomicrobium sp.]